jgi:predicted transcriptional regulator
MMHLSFDLDDDLARELQRVAGSEPPAVVLARALAQYLDQRGQLAHRRAVMEAVLTGRPLISGSPGGDPVEVGE